MLRSINNLFFKSKMFCHNIKAAVWYERYTNLTLNASFNTSNSQEASQLNPIFKGDIQYFTQFVGTISVRRIIFHGTYKIRT